MNKLLADQPVNSGRQKELDIARGFSVITMILIHSLQVFGTEKLESMYFGPPGAPVFAFLMGVGVIYSKKNDWLYFVKRGFGILALGYLLNLLRETLPYLVLGLQSGDATYRPAAFYAFFTIDILQFAGLALIFLGLMLKLQFKGGAVLLIGFSLALINLLLLGQIPENYYLSVLSGLFWGTGEQSYFPFLSWIIYPLAGYAFGQILMRCLNTNRFYALTFLFGWGLCALSAYVFPEILGLDIGWSSEYAYYHHSLAGNVVYTFYVIGWIATLFFFSKIVPELIYKTMSRWSKNSLQMYFTHWVLIGWIMIFTGFKTLEINYFLPLFLTIFIVSDLIVTCYKKFRSPKISVK